MLDALEQPFCCEERACGASVPRRTARRVMARASHEPPRSTRDKPLLGIDIVKLKFSVCLTNPSQLFYVPRLQFCAASIYDTQHKTREMGIVGS